MGRWSKQAKASLSQRNYTQAGDFFKLDGNFKAAIKAYTNGKNFTEAARIYEGLGQYSKAEKLLRKEATPKDVAEFYIRNEDPDRAIRVYMDVGLNYEAAELLEKSKKLAEAASLYEKLKFYEKAGILYGKTRNFDKAIEMVSRVIDGLSDGNIPLAKSKILKYRNWIANFHIGARRFAEAGEIFLGNDNKEKAAKCFHKGGQPLRTAEILLELGNLEGAEKVLSNVQALEGRVLLGKIANSRGNYELTVNLLRDANQPELLSEAYENLGQFIQAAAQQEKLGNLRRAAEMYSRAQDHGRAAILYEQNGMYKEAAGNYEKLKKYGHAAKLYHMAKDRFKAGLCLFKFSRMDDALKQLQLVDQDHPDILEAKNIMAEIFFEQGVYSVARRLLEEVTSKLVMDDSTMKSFYFLARCLEEEQSLASAKKYYERIVARKYNYSDVTQRLKHLLHIQATATGKLPTTASTKGLRPFDLKPRDIIDDRFEIVGTIGKGGMGSIFHVRDISLDRDIALKMLTHKKADFEELKVELLIARDLTHPYIIKVFDVGLWNEIGYFTMEYVKGLSLKGYIHEREDDPLMDKVRLLVKICKGLKAAHDMDVVHRDIKPQNILVDQQGNPKVLDFGIARKVAQKSNSISGSPKYMAPEQIQNTGTDVRTDIYALGIIMFYMFTLKEPFVGKSPAEVLKQHLEKPLPNPMDYNPSLPYWLCDIIHKCCQKKPDMRFGDMAELVNELELNLMEF